MAKAGIKLQNTSELRFFREGNPGNQRAAGVDFDQPKKQAAAPIELPSALEFPGENGDHGVRQSKFFTRFHEQFHEGPRVISLDHFEVEVHGTNNCFLVALETAAAIIPGS